MYIVSNTAYMPNNLHFYNNKYNLQDINYHIYLLKKLNFINLRFHIINYYKL
jgi:hypothetical protein